MHNLISTATIRDIFAIMLLVAVLVLIIINKKVKQTRQQEKDNYDSESF
jgi:tetrahydromethanopterin S-methyltransferase subunit E